MSCYVFTSATINYLPKVRVLARTVKALHPEIIFSVILAEPLPRELDSIRSEFDDLVTIDELGMANLESWIFKHSIVECCTAIKPIYLCRLLEKVDCSCVIYLDPDIAVLSSMQTLIGEVEQSTVAVTPHILQPESSTQAITSNELTAMKYGTFNLGFVGVKNCPQGKEFAQWWQNRLLDYCYEDFASGLFTDQRWIDLAPAFFDGLQILRNPGYNVATWNLTQRKVRGNFTHGFTANEEPLVFYHFSGFDSGAQLEMLDKFGADMPALFQLREWYEKQCRLADRDELSKRIWKYSSFDNGVLISKEHREKYKSEQTLQTRFPSPFSTSVQGQSFYEFCRLSVSSSGMPEPKPSQAAGQVSPEIQPIESSGFFPIFDPDFYLSQYPDINAGNIEPLIHFMSAGAEELRNPGPLFDSRFYATQLSNTTLKNPLAHFLTEGWRQGLDPHPLFDTRFYLSNNPGLVETGVNPLCHYLLHGADSGLNPHPLFDTAYYLRTNEDVFSLGLNPLVHFVMRGGAEGRNPHPLFDSEYYLHQNHSAMQGVNPLIHYLLHGAIEGRNPHPLFDSDYYLSQFPMEKAKAITNPLLHFVQSREDIRDPHKLFDVSFYLESNPQLAKSEVNPLVHFLQIGMAAKRNPHKNFDMEKYLERHPEIDPAKTNALVHFLKKRAFEQLFDNSPDTEYANEWPNILFDARQKDARFSQFLSLVKNRLPIVLFIYHYWDGGVSRHVDELLKLGHGKFLPLILRSQASTNENAVQLCAPTANCQLQVTTDLKADFDRLVNFLRDAQVQRVHVHHTLGFGPFVKRLIEELGVPFDFTAHDYYVLSPQPHLTNENGTFAGEPDEPNSISAAQVAITSNHQLWRRQQEWLIKNASRVIVPSKDTEQRLQKYFKNRKFICAYHNSFEELEKAIQVQPLAPNAPLRVLVLGEMQPHKGAAILNEAALSAKKRELPITFELLGATTYAFAPADQSNLTLHGRYEDRELQHLITQRNPHIVWFCSQSPETYSYTLSAAFAAGLPVLVPDIGAFPERIQGRSWSFMQHWNATADEWLERLLEIRDEHFTHAIPPPLIDRKLQKASSEFYHREYFNWIESPRASAAPLLVPAKRRIKPRALGVLLCFNEGDQLPDAIEHLLANDHELVVWDHGSNDQTPDVLNKYRKDLIEHKVIARDFDFYEIYAAMSRNLISNYISRYDWISWPDQDEILEGPDRTNTYYESVVEVFNSPYDWLLFHNFLYWFTSEDDASIQSPARRIRRYSRFPLTADRARAWRSKATNIRWFNHNPPEGERYPHMFNLRHYQMRSHELALDKINRSRSGIQRGNAIFYYANMSRWPERIIIEPNQLHFDDGVRELNHSPIFDWQYIYGTAPNQGPSGNAP
ncbi:MAG TPA: glycosyltransferase [Candidatus Melainabacteria bacterium]|nr:glycosyltransferase [Candidatus Melainabacteria bacterium]HIN64914.1 glycosyltransferase [Candidatus Obscuribacterales bacterium]